ncbi:hypothetical protein ONZ43_g3081 [Nemania bipapillata]|uniref:Uncharacterized protein n=1 Tax=Nemania bipapillata TaxID=110536 RepID=A0ACC2IYT1_9PEZI|nr:hypothetical protein ONZ43_g3081 [Nemania bipapillata]
MGDFNIVSGQPQAAGASYKDAPKSPVQLDGYNNDTSQVLSLVPYGNYLSANPFQESQSCTKNVNLGHTISMAPQPPTNFSKVSEGLYRSGYPQKQDYPFLQSLKLKTIVTLVTKDLPEGYQEFIQSNRITHRVFDMAGTKKEDIPVDMMRAIHAVVSNPRNYPLLVHCNHGKHRTGCVVGVLRKYHQWDLKCIIDEYKAFAEPKARETDLKYLTDFDLASLGRQPQAVVLRGTALLGTIGRFFRLAFLVVLTMLILHPLTKFKIKEPDRKSDEPGRDFPFP